MNQPATVLLVEDNPGDARLIREMLAETGTAYQVETVERAGAAIDRLLAGGIDVVLLDLGLPDSRGQDTFTRIHDRAEGVPVIVLTGLGDESVGLSLVRQGAQDFLVKGQTDGNLLARAIRYAVERSRAEGELREREERFRQLADNIKEVFFVMDATYQETLYISPAYEQIWGRSCRSLYDNPLSFLEPLPPEDRARLMADITSVQQGEEPRETEFRVVQPDGEVRWVLSKTAAVRNKRGEVYRISGIALDITERHSLESQFRQAQKMEAVGRLAAGVAHDFNNLLTVITTFTDLVLEDFGPTDPRREYLDEVLKASGAAAGLTRQLLAFSRQQVIEPKLITVEDVVKNAEKLLNRLIGEDVELVSTLGAVPATVKIDPGQLEQVIMNLAVNARDAMPMGGKLTLETGRVELDAAYARSHWPAMPGRFAMLAVSDNGTGMDAATQARIFEPFFTTKEHGKGTGLGLATVYGIVKQSGGFIWVYSELGQGTTFKIYLPEIDAAPSAPELRTAPSRSLRGTETVLLTEDAPAVRAAARQVLERHGYTVLEAPHGKAALGIALKLQGPIHLLLTDVVMPEMSGRQLAEEITAARPAIKVLYMSGYTDDAVVRHGVLEPGIAFLQKPFTSEALARKLREVLDSSPE